MNHRHWCGTHIPLRMMPSCGNSTDTEWGWAPTLRNWRCRATPFASRGELPVPSCIFSGPPGTSIRQLQRRTRNPITDLNDEPIDHVFAGQGIRLVLKYKSQAVGKVPLVALSVLSADATKLFHVDNVTRNQALPLSKEEGEYVCTIPKLPLTPGLYQINACLLLNEITVDHIWTAATLEVLPGDFFDAGKVAEHFNSIVYVDHEWS